MFSFKRAIVRRQAIIRGIAVTPTYFNDWVNFRWWRTKLIDFLTLMQNGTFKKKILNNDFFSLKFLFCFRLKLLTFPQTAQNKEVLEKLSWSVFFFFLRWRFLLVRLRNMLMNLIGMPINGFRACLLHYYS